MRVLLLLLLCSPVWAAFPQIESIATSEFNADANPAVSMPATVGADSLLISCGSMRGAGGNSVTWDTTTYGVWTEYYGARVLDASMYCAAILADGDEDSGSIENTIGTTLDSVWITVSISNWENDTVGNGTTMTNANGSTSTPDPPSVTPAWGSADNLIFTYCGLENNSSGGWSVFSLPRRTERCGRKRGS